MGGRRLTRQGTARKQRLIAEAARLFAHRGYHATRVIDIATSAGVAKGLFYWYFKNKESLFREIVTFTREDLRRVQARAIEAEDDPVARIARGIETSLRFMHDNQHLSLLLRFAGTQEKFAPLIEQAQEIHAADTARHIEEGIEKQRIAPGDPMMMAHGIVAIVFHFARLLASGVVTGDIEDLCRFVSAYCLRALGALPLVAEAGPHEGAQLARPT